jgi:isopentenyl-diphosphate delta-isomerase
MAEVTPTSSRKSEHIRINLNEDVQSGITSGLERYQFVHQALPEIDLDAIDLTLSIFNKQLQAPILISSMTGGTPEAARINQILATAAQAMGIAMGLGSQRAAIESPDLANTFKVRRFAPDIVLFANLGAIQLNYGYTIDHCQQAVDMVEADALILHLNALQEAIQSEGNTRFSGLLKKIEVVCRRLPVPVIVKEVGWGISAQCATQLAAAGVAAIDVAGAGGTSWSQVEKYRAQNEKLAKVAEAFRNWGIPTAESIRQVRQSTPNLLIFASGGLHDGVDIAKCIALGAQLGGMAGPFLKTASKNYEKTIDKIKEIKLELQACMFVAGVSDLASLKKVQLIDRYQIQAYPE